MKNDEPHSIADNEPSGHQTETEIKVKRRKKRMQKIIVSVGFDENLKEFKLWDHLYDFNTDHFEMEALPDYTKRIQYYEITAEFSSMRKLRLWLMNNDFKYSLDKK